MKIRTRFLPKIVDLTGVKFGDLLVINDDDTARLVLAVEGQNGDQRGVVLAAWGQRTGGTLPNSGLLIHLHDANHPLRLIDGELLVEPSEHNEGTSLVSQGHANGALAVFDNGEIGIRVAASGGGAWVWSLFTGKMLSTSSTKYWLKHWRLVWRDGDDEIPLCEFPRSVAPPSS